MVSFRNDSVEVSLHWAEEDSVLYYPAVTPQVSVLVEDTSSIQLTVQYNMQYNFSILPSLCGQSGTATIIELNFSKLITHWHDKSFIYAPSDSR